MRQSVNHEDRTEGLQSNRGIHVIGLYFVVFSLHLQTELPQVMVHVQVRPSHPRRFRHPSEDRVRRPVVVPVLGRDGFQQRLELCEVRREVARLRSPEFLIHLRPCRDSRGHRSGSVERNPLDERRLERCRSRACRLLMRDWRNASLRWHTIWCADIRPHRRVHSGRTVFRRRTISALSAGRAIVFMCRPRSERSSPRSPSRNAASARSRPSAASASSA